MATALRRRGRAKLPRKAKCRGGGSGPVPGRGGASGLLLCRAYRRDGRTLLRLMAGPRAPASTTSHCRTPATHQGDIEPGPELC